MSTKENDLEELVDRQYTKVHHLDKTTSLIKSKYNIKDDLQRMHNQISEISYGIVNMRKDLEKMNEKNAQLRELILLFENLDKKIIDQEKNVPPEMIQGYLNANKKIYNSTFLSPNIINSTVNSFHQLADRTPRSTYKNIEKHETVKDCKRTLFSEPDICLTIPLITVEEFNKVPKYMIGRQSLETINSLINSINQTLIAKYTILSLGKVAAQKKGEINLYLQYKKQELDVKEENRYLYFFTAEDYYRQTKTKIDKTKLNLITALRHCKRLRECRIKNELLYVITQH